MNGMMGMGGMNTAKPERKGTDIRSKDSKADREKKNKEMEEKKGPSFFDAYFNIVEVTVYGRARFFLAPPVEAAPEPSLGETPAATTTPPAAGNTAGPAEKPGAAKSTAAPSDADAAAKADAEKPAAKADAEKPAAKADAEKPAAKAGQPDGKGAVPKS